MAKTYKFTPTELTLSPKEHYEDNLDKIINNETITDDEKLILLPNLRVLELLKMPKQEVDLSEITSIVVDLMPHSYPEQSNRLFELSR